MVRLLLSIPIGIAITFVLFVIMAELIANNKKGPGEVEKSPRIDIVMSRPDTSVQQRQRTPPPPPPPPSEPPKVPKAQPEAADTSTAGISVDIPNIDTSVGDSGLGGIGGNLMQDGDATPIVRFEPKMPLKAKREGIEGWVRLRFSIEPDGSTSDIEVVAAEPKRVFDREATKALKRWKYKSKIVDGKAVKQTGLEVQLDFSFNDKK